jgi:hypothetical protein
MDDFRRKNMERIKDGSGGEARSRFMGVLGTLGDKALEKLIAAVIVAIVAILAPIFLRQNSVAVTPLDSDAKVLAIRSEADCYVETLDGKGRADFDRERRAFRCSKSWIRLGTKVRVVVGTFVTETDVVLDQMQGLVVQLGVTAEELSERLRRATARSP